VTLVKDAIASFGHQELEASLKFNMPAYANAIITTEQFLARLAASGSARGMASGSLS